MKSRLLVAVAALIACSGAWSEIIYLDCKTTNRELTEQGGYDRVFALLLAVAGAVLAVHDRLLL